MGSGARRYSLKTQKLNPYRRGQKKKRERPPSALENGQRRTIIVTEPPDMLADVHAKFGGRPPRSRRAARPPSWRRRRDRTPRIRAAHQSRSTTSEGLRGCPPDVGCTPDLIFPGARPSGAPVRTRHRTRRAASRDPTPFARWSGSIRIGTDWRMWPMPSPRAPAALLVRSGLSWCARHRCGKSSLISGPTSLGRTGGGRPFMDGRPSKNPPRPSNVSTCRVRLSVM